MTNKQLVTKAKVRKKAYTVLESLNDLMKRIEKAPNSIVYNELWMIRAELELLVVECKYLLEKDKKEEWQKEYDKKKEVGNKEKAKKMIREQMRSKEEMKKVFAKDFEEGYRQLWKLKETITLSMKAFPLPKYRKIEGEWVKEREKIFEI